MKEGKYLLINDEYGARRLKLPRDNPHTKYLDNAIRANKSSIYIGLLEWIVDNWNEQNNEKLSKK